MTLSVDIVHRQGQFALNARFETGPGLTVLFGRSGAGKTTLINVIGGLIRPDRGRVAVDGAVLVDTAHGVLVPAHRRRIGYIFQEGRLFPHLTVRQNLAYGRWFAPRASRYARFDHTVELLGIGDLLDRRTHSLSGGEKQRVAIGRALLASPRILLMDEPLAALDALRKDEIMPYIERLRDEMRLPIIYVSHSIPEVARLATTVVLLNEGTVAAVGPVGEVMARADLFPMTGRYEAGAVLDTTVAGHDHEFGLSSLSFGGHRLSVPLVQAPIGAPVRIRVRARDVILALRAPEGLSAQNALPATVRAVPAVTTPIVDVALDVGGRQLVARVTRKSVVSLGLTPGKAVFVLIKSIAFDGRTVVPGAEPPDDDPAIVDN
ncbi:MAG: molybdenum ABC transporter ATP-binding protein [Rhodospirillales bacterium]